MAAAAHAPQRRPLRSGLVPFSFSCGRTPAATVAYPPFRGESSRRRSYAVALRLQQPKAKWLPVPVVLVLGPLCGLRAEVQPLRLLGMVLVSRRSSHLDRVVRPQSVNCSIQTAKCRTTDVGGVQRGASGRTGSVTSCDMWLINPPLSPRPETAAAPPPQRRARSALPVTRKLPGSYLLRIEQRSAGGSGAGGRGRGTGGSLKGLSRVCRHNDWPLRPPLDGYPGLPGSRHNTK